MLIDVQEVVPLQRAKRHLHGEQGGLTSCGATVAVVCMMQVTGMLCTYRLVINSLILGLGDSPIYSQHPATQHLRALSQPSEQIITNVGMGHIAQTLRQ